MPRVSIDRTDDLTDYEFEYECIQDHAYKQMIKDAMNKHKVNLADGSIQREFSMDQEEYDQIVNIAEDDFIDFEIPKDTPEGKRMSESVIEKENIDEQIPVDLDQIFKN